MTQDTTSISQSLLAHLGDGWAVDHRTCNGQLAWKCPHCHALKSHKGWRDGPLLPNGKRGYPDISADAGSLTSSASPSTAFATSRSLREPAVARDARGPAAHRSARPAHG